MILRCSFGGIYLFFYFFLVWRERRISFTDYINVCVYYRPQYKKIHAERQRIVQELEFGPGGDGGWWAPLILHPEVPATRLAS